MSRCASGGGRSRYRAVAARADVPSPPSAGKPNRWGRRQKALRLHRGGRGGGRDHPGSARCRWASVGRAPPREDRQEDPAEEDQPQREPDTVSEALRQIVQDDDVHDELGDRDEDPDQPPRRPADDLQHDVEAVDRDERAPRRIAVRARLLVDEVRRQPDDDPEHDEVDQRYAQARAAVRRCFLCEEHPRPPFREGPGEDSHAVEVAATTYGENDTLLYALLVD